MPRPGWAPCDRRASLLRGSSSACDPTHHAAHGPPSPSRGGIRSQRSRETIASRTRSTLSPPFQSQRPSSNHVIPRLDRGTTLRSPNAGPKRAPLAGPPIKSGDDVSGVGRSRDIARVIPRINGYSPLAIRYSLFAPFSILHSRPTHAPPFPQPIQPGLVKPCSCPSTKGVAGALKTPVRVVRVRRSPGARRSVLSSLPLSLSGTTGIGAHRP